MNRVLIWLFSFLSLVNIYAVLIQWQMGIYFSKPLLLTILSCWFYLSVKNGFTSFAKLIVTALVFSIAGDVFLMFVPNNPSFFLFGLGSFLVTHLLYIFSFVKYKGFKGGFVMKNKWLVVPVLTYLISFIHLSSPSSKSNKNES